MSEATPGRSWARRLGLVLFWAGAALALSEVGVRLIPTQGPADILFNAPDTAPRDLYCTDRQLFLKPRPGFQGPHRSLGWSVDIRINSLGLRGPEPGPKTRPRWLVTGDSFTIATQVAEEQTFVSRLSGRTDSEFFNAGADSYATWQAVERYRRLDEVLELDGVVLVFFVGNDLEDNRLFSERLASQPSPGQPDCSPFDRRQHSPVRAFLAAHSHLYARGRMLLQQRRLSREHDPERLRWQRELSLFAGGADLEEAMVDTRQALESLRAEVARRGDQLLVAVAPPAFQIDPERLRTTMDFVGLPAVQQAADAPGDLVLQELDRQGIRSCDLTPPLRQAHARGEALYFTYDGHWTPQGHAVVAEALARCAEESLGVEPR